MKKGKISISNCHKLAKPYLCKLLQNLTNSMCQKIPIKIWKAEKIPLRSFWQAECMEIE